MKRLFAALALVAALAACGRSTDDQFIEACREQIAAGGRLESMAKSLCDHPNSFPDTTKKQFVESWNAVKADPEIRKIVQGEHPSP